MNKHFIPVKLHIKENRKGFKRYGVEWTPTIIIADPSGSERYRFEGYLPVEEFLPLLEFGLGKAAFATSKWKEAEQWFRNVVEHYPQSDIAPAALYWAGAAKFKETGDASVLTETAAALQSRYPESIWTKKASVWAAPHESEKGRQAGDMAG